MKIYTKNEIEALCSVLFKEAAEEYPEISDQDLAALFIYAGSYILHMTTDVSSSPFVDKALKDAAIVAYKWLTTPPLDSNSNSNSPETDSLEKGSVENAPLPINEESSEVQGDNRKDSEDVSSE